MAIKFKIKKIDYKIVVLLMKMYFEKQHLITSWVILETIMDFKAKFKTDMILNNMDATLIRKIILSCELIEFTRGKPEWNTKDESIIAQIVSYVFFQLCHHKQELDECLCEIDRRAHQEQKTGVMTMKEYVLHRRTFFELKRTIDILTERGDITHKMTFLDNKRIEIHL
jgi:hypothetical protein